MASIDASIDTASLAIAAGSAAVQMLSVGSAVVGTGHNPTSPRGHVELGKVADDVRILSDQVLAAQQYKVPFTEDDEALKRLAHECQMVAEEAVYMLKSLTLDPEAEHRTWDRLRNAVRTQRKASEVERLRDRLDNLLQMLNIHLQSRVL